MPQLLSWPSRALRASRASRQSGVRPVSLDGHHRNTRIRPSQPRPISRRSRLSWKQFAATSRTRSATKDREYIRRAVAFQRCFEIAARLIVGVSTTRSGWMLGTVALAAAKCIENMELAHNVIHGQWDWMNDPEIHSATWEWDMVGPSSHWRSSHNHRHHKFTNVVGVDDDLGFGVLRVTRDQEWTPSQSAPAVARGAAGCRLRMGRGFSRPVLDTGGRNHPGR